MGDINTLFTIQWGDVITQLAQAGAKQKIANNVMQKPGVVGKQTTMEQLGSIELVKKTSRHSPTPRADANHQRRWITLFDYRRAVWFDTEDELKALLDPRNAYNQAFIMGMNRASDNEVFDNVFGTAYYGADGSSEQANSNQIANGGTGLTFEKLKTIIFTFENANIDLEVEQPHLAAGPRQHKDMLGLTEIISKEYNEAPVIENGRVKRIMGLEIAVTTLVNVASSIRACVAYVPSGIGLAIAKSPSLRASELPEHDYAWQGYASIGIGSSRLEEEKVIDVQCSEA